MKKLIYLSVIFATFSFIANAQNDPTGDDWVTPPAGRTYTLNPLVGIGTATPTVKLQVHDGNINISSSGAHLNPEIRIWSEDGLNTSSYRIRNMAGTQLRLDKRSASGPALIDYNPMPLDNAGPASFRFFRNTNTTGDVFFSVYKGNNTATLNGQIGGNIDTYFAADNGNVGIGTATPTNKFSVMGVSDFMGNVGFGTTSPSTMIEVQGDATATTNLVYAQVNHSSNSDTRAFLGTSTPAPGYGFGGQFTGGYRGVLGTGQGSTYTGSVIGVQGSASGTAGTRYALYGSSSNSGGNYSFGLYASAFGGNLGTWAGYFAGGDVNVQNNLRVGNGSFSGTADARLYVDQSSGTDRDTLVCFNQNSTNTSGLHYGVRVQNDAATSSTSYGIYQQTNTTDGRGVRYGFYNDMNNNASTPDASSQYGNFTTIDANGSGTRYGYYASLSGSSSHGGNKYGVYSFVSSTGASGSRYGGYFSCSNGNANTTGWATYQVGNSYVSGDLRVGTTTGATGYKVSVNGKIACEELLIDDSGSWPDYVFNKDYDLWPLEDVEAYINNNNHLPGVPDAECVETDGISVGEMSKVMMEKIEELSLYIIEINNRVKTLETENTLLKTELTKQN